MADITTVEGLRVLFDPAGITAVASSDEQTGPPGAVIFGIGPAALTVSQSVNVLLQGLKLTPSFARLTRPDGSPVWVNCKSISMARPPTPGEYPAEIRSVIFAGALKQAVRESLDDARQAINHAGGNL
jgi:hypothetical protein